MFLQKLGQEQDLRKKDMKSVEISFEEMIATLYLKIWTSRDKKDMPTEITHHIKEDSKI